MRMVGSGLQMPQTASISASPLINGSGRSTEWQRSVCRRGGSGWLSTASCSMPAWSSIARSPDRRSRATAYARISHRHGPVGDHGHTFRPRRSCPTRLTGRSSSTEISRRHCCRVSAFGDGCLRSRPEGDERTERARSAPCDGTRAPAHTTGAGDSKPWDIGSS